MKKLLSITLVLAMVLTLIPFAAFAEDKEYETVNGTIMFNAGHDDMETDHPCPFTYSDSYFTDTAYNYRQDLATVTMAMCLAAGNVADPSRYTEGPANLKNFFDQIGFEDFEANEDFVTRPGRNTFGVGIANKEIVVDGEKYTIIAVGLRGCGYYAEWAGDLNVGLSGDHEGFAICRDTALAFLKDYLAKHTEIEGKIKIWCTGYSRGAAGANMLGGAIDDMIVGGQKLGSNVSLSLDDVYIYTFEAPMGAHISKINSNVYNNIHNVVNYNDLVVKVVPESLEMGRYGVDHYMPTSDFDENYNELKSDMLEVFATFENAGEYRIDDFKYVTITPGATIDKIISSIKGDKMTQGEFLDHLVAVLFEELGSREDIYAMQGGLQELLVVLIGTYPDQWDTVKASLTNNAKDNFKELVFGLVSGDEGSSIELVANIILKSFAQAGITDVDAAAVKQIATDLVKFAMPLAMKYPDEIATLLYNVVGIMSAHYGELGMSWMLTIPEDYMINKQIKSAMPFDDIGRSTWCYNEVKYTYDNGIMNGRTLNTFMPNSIVTRGQVVTVLYRLEGSPSVEGMSCDLKDVEGSWCEAAITWAYELGIAEGFNDGYFKADEQVTREQLSAFLYRYADKLVYDGDITVGDDFPKSLGDSDSVSAFARESMIWAVENGIINGTNSGDLDPKGNATRAQFACMIARFVQTLG